MIRLHRLDVLPIARLLTGLLLLAWTGGMCAADDLLDAANEAVKTYRAELEKIAATCDELGLEEQAARTRELLPRSAPDVLFMPRLPETVGSFDVAVDAPLDVRQWQRKLADVRTKHANELLGMAKSAHGKGRTSLALDMLLAALHADPDHVAIRGMFGYLKYNDQWHTEYEIAKMRSGRVWHERFGWIPIGHVERYENGERFFQGRWISAEEEARRRNTWTVETEHFTIRTSAGLEQGVELATKLEQLHRVWRQLFLQYAVSKPQLDAMFAGNGTNIRLPRHEVIYFRDRDQYVQTMMGLVPGGDRATVERTVGMYHSGKRQTYFYPSDDWRTVWHETTHQLFQEMRNASPASGVKANFWIIEGIACYMESFRTEGDYHLLGGFEHDVRLRAALVRLIDDKFYVPLTKLTVAGRAAFQQSPNVPMLYSQSAGLTHFLIHGEHGRYRDAIVRYLTLVYAGRDTRTTLQQQAGQSYESLDKQYAAFIEDGVRIIRAAAP